MDQENIFRYHYSPPDRSEVRAIRDKYLSLLPSRHYMKEKEFTAMNKNDQQFLVQKIRTQYTEKEHTRLDELKELDARVKRPVNVFSYLFGSVSAIVMGAGMSLVMTDIGSMIGMENTMAPGIAIGVAGMVLAIANYPLHKALLSSRRKKYADQIIALSDKLMEQ